MTAVYPPEQHLLRDLRFSFEHDDAGLAFLRETQPVAIVHSGRDIYLQLAYHLAVALAMALTARIAYHLAATAAGMAGPPHGKETLFIEDLPASIAGGTGGRAATGLGAGRVAVVAGLHARNLDLRRHAEYALFEADLQIVPNVFTPLRTAPATAPAA